VGCKVGNCPPCASARGRRYIVIHGDRLQPVFDVPRLLVGHAVYEARRHVAVVVAGLIYAVDHGNRVYMICVSVVAIPDTVIGLLLILQPFYPSTTHGWVIYNWPLQYPWQNRRADPPTPHRCRRPPVTRRLSLKNALVSIGTAFSTAASLPHSSFRAPTRRSRAAICVFG
jgi:hypothetical protein